MSSPGLRIKCWLLMVVYECSGNLERGEGAALSLEITQGSAGVPVWPWKKKAYSHPSPSVRRAPVHLLDSCPPGAPQ